MPAHVERYPEEYREKRGVFLAWGAGPMGIVRKVYQKLLRLKSGSKWPGSKNPVRRYGDEFIETQRSFRLDNLVTRWRMPVFGSPWILFPILIMATGISIMASFLFAVTKSAPLNLVHRRSLPLAFCCLRPGGQTGKKTWGMIWENDLYILFWPEMPL